MLTVDTRVNLLIIVSNATVDLLVDALTLIIRGVLPSNEVDVLDGNVFAGVIITFGLVISCLLEEFRC